MTVTTTCTEDKTRGTMQINAVDPAGLRFRVTFPARFITPMIRNVISTSISNYLQLAAKVYIGGDANDVTMSEEPVWRTAYAMGIVGFNLECWHEEAGKQNMEMGIKLGELLMLIRDFASPQRTFTPSIH